MRICGIDSGTLVTGIAVVDKVMVDNRPSFIIKTIQNIHTPKDEELPYRLVVLGKSIRQILSDLKPDVVFIEQIRFGQMSAKIGGIQMALKGEGACLMAAAEVCDDVRQVTANVVRKMLEAGNTKAAVRQAMNKKFKDQLVALGFPKGFKKVHEDISDALGMAVVGHVLYGKDREQSEQPG